MVVLEGLPEDVKRPALELPLRTIGDDQSRPSLSDLVVCVFFRWISMTHTEVIAAYAFEYFDFNHILTYIY